MDVDMWLVYRAFVIERHKIWERRQAGEPGPWTRDPILASRKFTNVFRVLDPGTQFVLTDLFPDLSLPERSLNLPLPFSTFSMLSDLKRDSALTQDSIYGFPLSR